MKKTGKRILALYLIFTLALTVAVTAHSDDKEAVGTFSSDIISEIGKSNFFYASEEEIFEEYEKCTKINAAYAGEYGGVYVDKSGNAVVNIKRNSGVAVASSNEASQTLTTSDGNRQIIVKEVKYSMAELKSINDKIMEFFPFIDNYVMREIGISSKKNLIEIKVKECDDIDKFIYVLLDRLNLTDSYVDMFDIGIFTSEDELYYE